MAVSYSIGKGWKCLVFHFANENHIIHPSIDSSTAYWGLIHRGSSLSGAWGTYRRIEVG